MEKQRQIVAVLLPVLIFAHGCKPTAVTHRSAGSRAQFAELYLSSTSEVQVKNNVFYTLFKREYELRLDQLPSNGLVDPEKVPYVGSWYPQRLGGTGRDFGSGSVLDKYDRAFNSSQNLAAQWEKANHTVAADSSAAGWAGHCNGFSAAALRHSEPKSDVRRGSETFTPKEIKALLAEIYMSHKFYFLGGNRCESQELKTPSERSDPYATGNCDDVNPATFHVALANWIGLLKRPLIFDISTQSEVWNYPFYRYESQVTPVENAAKAMELITGRVSDHYMFNPDAVGFRKVSTTVYHSRAYEKEYLTALLTKESDKFASVTYTYLLELDASGRIVGGEWLEKSQTDHPDFIWVAFEPGLPDGGKNGANPHVNAGEVIKMWAESVGRDLTANPLDLMEPKVDTAWGKFPKFSMTINGSASGAVFLGREQILQIQRQPELFGEITLELTLNGSSVAKQSLNGDGPVSISLPTPGPGLHRLDLRWLRGSELIDTNRVQIVTF